MRKPTIEILPSPYEIRQTPMLSAELERVVQQKVAEIMADRDALAFEPWFRSRKVAYELRRLQSVPEQRKFSIAYERFGCMICETHATPHAGNGLCQKCRSRWFQRLAGIIAEGVAGEPARAAKGIARAERLLPENVAPSVHHTWHQPSTEEEQLLYARVAERLRVSVAWVSNIARGTKKKSKVVSAALEEERALMLRERGLVELRARMTPRSPRP
jgi:hypothetical protein